MERTLAALFISAALVAAAGFLFCGQPEVATSDIASRDTQNAEARGTDEFATPETNRGRSFSSSLEAHVGPAEPIGSPTIDASSGVLAGEVVLFDDSLRKVERPSGSLRLRA